MLAPMTAMRPVSSPVNGSSPAAAASTGAEATAVVGAAVVLTVFFSAFLRGLDVTVSPRTSPCSSSAATGVSSAGAAGVDHGGRGRRGPEQAPEPGRAPRRPGQEPRRPEPEQVVVRGRRGGRGLRRRRRRDRLGRRRVGHAGLRPGGRLVHARRAPARRRSRRHDEGSRHCERQRRGEEQPPRAARERVCAPFRVLLGCARTRGESATLFGIRAAASGLGGCGRPFEAHIGRYGWELERC